MTRQVLCRKVCIFPDFAGLCWEVLLIVCDGDTLTGTRVPLQCGDDAAYFDSIDECVPLSIAALPAFQAGIQLSKRCPGRVVRTVDDLEAVRFCTIVTGTLVLEVNDADADFTALHDIDEIQGRCWCDDADDVASHVRAGALVVQNSSMSSLHFLGNLFAVGGSGETFAVDGRQYSVVIQGLIAVSCSPSALT